MQDPLPEVTSQTSPILHEPGTTAKVHQVAVIQICVGIRGPWELIEDFKHKIIIIKKVTKLGFAKGEFLCEGKVVHHLQTLAQNLGHIQ